MVFSFFGMFGKKEEPENSNISQIDVINRYFDAYEYSLKNLILDIRLLGKNPPNLKNKYEELKISKENTIDKKIESILKIINQDREKYRFILNRFERYQFLNDFVSDVFADLSIFRNFKLKIDEAYNIDFKDKELDNKKFEKELKGKLIAPVSNDDPSVGREPMRTEQYQQ